MAKNNSTDTPTPAPPAEPTAAADPAAPVPDAGGEPVKQATAAMATEPGTAGRPTDPVLPPDASDYDMPDDYADDWLGRTRQWVEDNPVVAVIAAAGAGLVVGRLIVGLIPEPAPPTFAERVGKRAKQLRKDAAFVADDAGEVLAEQLKRAANALSDAAEVVAEKAEVGYEKTRDLADVVGDAVKAAVAGVVAKKADSWMDRLRG